MNKLAYILVAAALISPAFATDSKPVATTSKTETLTKPEVKPATPAKGEVKATRTRKHSKTVAKAEVKEAQPEVKKALTVQDKTPMVAPAKADAKTAVASSAAQKKAEAKAAKAAAKAEAKDTKTSKAVK